MLAQNIMQNKLSNGALDDNLRTVYLSLIHISIRNRSGTQTLLATNSLYKPSNSILSSLFPPFSGKTKRPKVHELSLIHICNGTFFAAELDCFSRGKHSICASPRNSAQNLPAKIAQEKRRPKVIHIALGLFLLHKNGLNRDFERKLNGFRSEV